MWGRIWGEAQRGLLRLQADPRLPPRSPGPKRACKATPSPLRSKPHRSTATGTELSAGGGRSSYAEQGRGLGRRLATDQFQVSTRNTRVLPDNHTARHGSLRGVLSALLAPLEAPRLPSAVGEWVVFLGTVNPEHTT